MKRSRIFLFLAILITLTLVFTACKPAAEEPVVEEVEEAEEAEEVKEEVFKLGILGPFSGPSAQTGKQFTGGATIALEEFDYKIGHYTIEPVWIDSQSDPAKAAQAYEQAVVQDGIQVGTVNWHSSVAVSVMEVTAKHKIPHIFGFGATEVVNETFASDTAKYGYWSTKGWPTPSKLGNKYIAALEYYIEQGVYAPEEKIAAIFGEDSDWGRSFGTEMKRMFEEAGWEVVAEEYFPVDQIEFTPLWTKWMGENVQVVAGTNTGVNSSAAFISQADEVGYEGLIIADGLGWVDFCSLTGSSANMVMDQI
ncbi:MAG: ABC transporter substrate-binding protein, partial [Chloroflexota bacterium]|nr:ABC transporter substrate-binding protein [Chloroflexota bacterium]